MKHIARVDPEIGTVPDKGSIHIFGTTRAGKVDCNVSRLCKLSRIFNFMKKETRTAVNILLQSRFLELFSLKRVGLNFQ